MTMKKTIKEVVTDFIKSNMHLNIQDEDILSAERMGLRNTGDKKPRWILVKFNSVWSKKDACHNKRVLKGLDLPEKVYITQDVTK